MPEVLITGANKGLGYAAAKALGQRGYHVWLGSRSVERGEEAAARLRGLDGVDVDVVQLDVTAPKSISSAVAVITDRTGHLDVLINNAGMSRELDPASWPPRPSTVPLAALREVFDTNFFGAIDVTQQFIPLLAKGTNPRIVNVSSSLGSFTSTVTGEPGSELLTVGYKSSKAALNMATILFAEELAEHGIKVNAATPRLTASDLTGVAPDAAAGVHTPDDGVTAVVELAVIGEDGPTATFHDADRVVGW